MNPGSHAMLYLIAGLLLFIGTHSLRIVAEDWRTSTRSRLGPGTWKAVYSLVALAGFALLVYGYGLSRQAPVALWSPPGWTRHATALLTLFAFIFLAAAYVPGTNIKARIGHPMVMSVKVWALAHLLSNGRLADVILFGSLLVWAVLDYIAARKRDRASGVSYPAVGVSRDIAAVVVGVVLTAVFAKWLHGPLIGVSAIG